MNEQYWNSVKKRPSFGLEGSTDTPDMLEQAAMTPEVDFTKSSFADQAPVGTKSFEDIGGKDMTNKPAGAGMDYKAGGIGAAASLAQGGSPKEAIASGLVATGNPWAVGAGLGLMTLSSIEKKKQQQKETEYKNKLAQVEARRSAIDKLAQIGQGMQA